MRYLIDSDCTLYAMTGKFPALRQRIADCEPGAIGLSTVSFAEVMLGTAAGKPPSLEMVEAFVQAIPLVAFDEAAARAYAVLPFRRARFDRLLAAHAISLDVAIITNNTVDFADIPGLRIENWTQ